MRKLWILVDRKYTFRQVRMKHDFATSDERDVFPRGFKGNIYLRNVFDGELMLDDKNE